MRLAYSKTAPGDTCRRYPHLRQISGVREGKDLAVDGETRYNRSSNSPEWPFWESQQVISRGHLVLAAEWR